MSAPTKVKWTYKDAYRDYWRIVARKSGRVEFRPPVADSLYP